VNEVSQLIFHKVNTDQVTSRECLLLFDSEYFIFPSEV
jgi:hypothetical protein